MKIFLDEKDRGKGRGGLREGVKTTIQRLLFRFALSLVRRDWEKLKTDIARRVALFSNSPAMDNRLIDYLVLAEDRRHGRHFGFDVLAISRALWRRLTSDKREGASTIAQQLVRTLTNRRERTIRRKSKEVLLAVLVTYSFKPDDICKTYLKAAYYGWRMKDLDGACSRLGVNPGNVPDEEAAGLVARLKYPEPRNASHMRQTRILNRTKYLLRLSMRNARRKSLFISSVIQNEAI